MEPDFWKRRWQEGRTGWHLDRVYPPLKKYWPQFNLEPHCRIFVPLCGKSRDLLWLRDRGCRVVGNEIAEEAVEQFFSESGLSCSTTQRMNFKIFKSENIEIWQGDFFDLHPDFFGSFNLIYDRAALIALPQKMRTQYAEMLMALSDPQTSILLNSFEYDEQEMEGPPYAVFSDEIDSLFGNRFAIQLLQKESIIDDMGSLKQRGITSYLIEKVYFLTPKPH